MAFLHQVNVTLLNVVYSLISNSIISKHIIYTRGNRTKVLAENKLWWPLNRGSTFGADLAAQPDCHPGGICQYYGISAQPATGSATTNCHCYDLLAEVTLWTASGANWAQPCREIIIHVHTCEKIIIHYSFIIWRWDSSKSLLITYKKKLYAEISGRFDWHNRWIMWD